VRKEYPFEKKRNEHVKRQSTVYKKEVPSEFFA
jgi:hypothetical protein